MSLALFVKSGDVRSLKSLESFADGVDASVVLLKVETFLGCREALFTRLHGKGWHLQSLHSTQIPTFWQDSKDEHSRHTRSCSHEAFANNWSKPMCQLNPERYDAIGGKADVLEGEMSVGIRFSPHLVLCRDCVLESKVTNACGTPTWI